MDLLDQMATFVRIVDGKSLSAAARAQRLSLPAVSRQLRALEAELGAALVVRSTRQLRVTDAGQQWYAHCVRLLRELAEARAAVADPRAVRGRLVVSASLTFGASIVVPRLPALLAAHPQLTIDLRLEDHLVDLVADGVDVALRAGAPPPDSTAYVAHPLLTMHRMVVAAPRWLRKHGTPRTPAQLAALPCLVQVTPAGARIRWQLRPTRTERPHEGGEASLETVEVSGPLQCNTPAALRALAVDGAGPAYLPDWLVADDLAHGRLRRVLPDWLGPRSMAWAVYRGELRGAPRLRALLDALPRDAGGPPPAGARATRDPRGR